ncbi:MAG: MFS transporter [Deltaproteobacteria bacterium]|nr:MFS transporter [Deltaproteobacteria bacterium]
MMEDNQSGFYYGYVIVAAVFVVMIIIWGTFITFGVFFESLVNTFGWSRALTSGASSIRDLVFGVVCILTARLTDRFGPRIVVSLSGIFLGVGYLLMSQVSTPWQLYLYMGVIVACGGSAYITMLSIVARWFERRRGMMTAIVFSGMWIGSMIAPPIAQRLISVYGWRHSYIFIAIIGFALIILAAQFLKHSPGPETFADAGHSNETHGAVPALDGLTLGKALCTIPFWLTSILYFFFLYSILSILVHVVIHSTGLGITPAKAANILAIIGGMCVVGMNLSGATADRIGNKRTLTISFLLMTVSLIDLMIARQVWSLYLFAALFGLAYGGMQVIFSPLVAELFGLRSHGVVLGAAAFIASLGAALGPFVSGYIFDAMKSYDVAFVVCAIMTASGVILTLLLKPIARD